MNRAFVPTSAGAAAAVLSLAIAVASFPSGAATQRDPVAERVQAAAEGRGAEVSIPFADHGGIRNWQAVDRDTLLVEGTHRRWYRVELMNGCFELPFAQRVGFRSNPTGDFDRFSSVLVRGQRCAVKSVTEAPPPPRRAKDAESTTAAEPVDPAVSAATPAQPTPK